METIRLFMWGYQGHFQISVQVAAEALFQALHPQFEVETFLLGIAHADAVDVEPVCLHPEECGFDPSDFAQVRDLASHHRALDPERELMCMAESHQRSHDNQVTARAWRSAVLDVLNGWRKSKEGQYHFLGSVPVGKHEAGVVLRLKLLAKDQPYRLPKVHAEERYGAFHSLVETTVHEFLVDCTNALVSPDPTQVGMYRGRNTHELLREAGSRLMQTPVWAGEDKQWLYGLFSFCNRVAEMTYESEGTLGSMLIARTGHEHVRPTLTLASPVPLGEGRRVRKLLQIASVGDSLLCDGSNIVGFGRLHGNYDQSKADLFEVRFTRRHHWELLHAQHRMMRVSYGNPTLPRPALDTDKLISDLGRVFPESRPEQRDHLVALALATCEQRHGAVLVVSAQAETEAARLASQSTLIKPVRLTEDLLAAVTAIDGAALVAPDGTCYAIGVILDGIATPKGNPARGARFNSSMRYIQGRERCFIVIVSEDGTAEWVPNLLPQISRAKLNEIQREANEVLAEQDINVKKARSLLNWFSDHRFYLSEENCQAANELYKRYGEAARREGTPVILRAEFRPSPEMTAEHFVD